MFGNHDYDSEKLVAYELGFRSQPLENFSLDVATFFNDYDDLRTVSPRLGPDGKPAAFLETDPLPPHLVLPWDAGNAMTAHTWGVEVVADWWPLDGWRLRGGYTYFEMSVDLPASLPPETVGPGADGASPEQQAFLRSLLDLPYDLEFDVNLRWVDELPSVDVRSYGTADLRLGWRPREDLEISLVGQNLLDDKHMEFGGSDFFAISPSAVQRGFYGKIVWKP
ncbi:MAG: TonB-dependent receptor [Candidatus Dadabacteria bacterium]|nr:MAG: TonB-dependent receptor [Candidatus Dadabacteria bacterium]